MNNDGSKEEYLATKCRVKKALDIVKEGNKNPYGSNKLSNPDDGQIFKIDIQISSGNIDLVELQYF